MSKVYLNNDAAVDMLFPIEKGAIMHPVSKGSSLYLKQSPSSMRFIWRAKGKDISLGEYQNNVLEMLLLTKRAKIWLKENPSSDPKLFFNPEVTTDVRTFHDAWKDYWEWYKDDAKEVTWRDRQNKWKVIFDHFGKDIPLKGFELANGGKQKIYNFQKKICFERGKYSQGKRYRSVLKGFFKYCMTFEWIDSNPAELPHPDENKITTIRSSRPKRNQHIEWKDVPQLMDAINDNFGEYNLTDLAVKLHLMMSIRSSVIAGLRFEWYDHEKDYWVIPHDTKGLKKRKGSCNHSDFIIPSTPEINQLIVHIGKVIGRYEGYVFPSRFSKKADHICIDGMNDRLKEVSIGRQSAHGWRDVFVEGTQLGGFKPYIIDRCIGHTSHGHSSWTPYDEGKFINDRRKCMEWWTKELVNKGLVIEGKDIEKERMTMKELEGLCSDGGIEEEWIEELVNA